jgi:hypothetical protein
MPQHAALKSPSLHHQPLSGNGLRSIDPSGWLAGQCCVWTASPTTVAYCTAFPAQALQAEGAWHEAERHFCEAKEWKGAVAMYRQQGSWEDALRVAKVLGGMDAAKQVWCGSIRCSFSAVLSHTAACIALESDR